jgi:anti-anti-sigma factor
MELFEEKNDNCMIVSISGRLDTTNYTILEKKLTDLTDNGQGKILVDCAKMDYISSSGLRILLMILKKVNLLKGRFVLCGLQENIHEIFEISGFTSIFEIHPERETALKSI